TLAQIATVSYRSNGKKAVVIGSGNVYSNGLLLGGQLTARIVVRLDHDACAERAKLTASGTIEVQTSNGAITLNLRRAKLQTSGKQLRPVAGSPVATGSGNYGLVI